MSRLEDATRAIGAALAPFFPAPPPPVHELTDDVVAETDDISGENDLALAETPHTQEFLADFRRRVLAAAKDGGELTEDVLLACMKGARGHAGGYAAAAKRREMAESVEAHEDDDGEKLLSEFAWGVELGEGKPIQIMRTGDFKHPEYGAFSITPKDLAEIKANFDAKVRGQDIPIDIDHEHDGGAIGWVKDLAVKGESLWATPDWTDKGTDLVREGSFRYFSPHFGPWQDPESKQKHRVVLMSGAITNFPFLKNMEPIALSEFAKQKGASMSANVEELEKQLTEAKESAAKAEETAVQAKADAEAREKALTEAQEREKTLTERVVRMERDGMVKRLTERIRGNGNPNHRVIGDEDSKVTFALKLAETFGEDSTEVKHYLEEQEAVSTALREAGVFTEKGSSQSGVAGNARNEFEAKLNEVMDKNPSLNRGEASARVLSENPRLYDQYNADQPAGKPRG